MLIAVILNFAHSDALIGDDAEIRFRGLRPGAGAGVDQHIVQHNVLALKKLQIFRHPILAGFALFHGGKLDVQLLPGMADAAEDRIQHRLALQRPLLNEGCVLLPQRMLPQKLPAAVVAAGNTSFQVTQTGHPKIRPADHAVQLTVQRVHRLIFHTHPIPDPALGAFFLVKGQIHPLLDGFRIQMFHRILQIRLRPHHLI